MYVGKPRLLIHKYCHVLVPIFFRDHYHWDLNPCVGDTSWPTDISWPGWLGGAGSFYLSLLVFSNSFMLLYHIGMHYRL